MLVNGVVALDSAALGVSYAVDSLLRGSSWVGFSTSYEQSNMAVRNVTLVENEPARECHGCRMHSSYLHAGDPGVHVTARPGQSACR